MACSVRNQRENLNFVTSTLLFFSFRRFRTPAMDDRQLLILKRKLESLQYMDDFDRCVNFTFFKHPALFTPRLPARSSHPTLYPISCMYCPATSLHPPTRRKSAPLVQRLLDDLVHTTESYRSLKIKTSRGQQDTEELKLQVEVLQKDLQRAVHDNNALHVDLMTATETNRKQERDAYLQVCVCVCMQGAHIRLVIALMCGWCIIDV